MKNPDSNQQIAPQIKSARKYKLLDSALSNMQRDDTFKAKLKRQALLRYANAYMEQYNQTHTKKINKNQAKEKLLKEAAAKESKENKADVKQDTIAQELYRLNSYEILCSAGKCGETGEQSFNALSAQEKEDGKIYFRRGKDSHEEGRYIARETMLLHPKENNKTYYLQTGKNGNSSNLIQGFLEEMLANGHHSLVQSKQFSFRYKDYLGYPSLIDKENEHQLILTAENFESWCNKGSIGELILLNAAQKYINTQQQPPKTTLTEYIYNLNPNNIKDLLENPNDNNFETHKAKIKEKFKEIKAFLVNKAINIEGLKGLQSICKKPDNEDYDKFYSKIYNLLQQDSGRNEGLELDLEQKKVYTTNILSDTTRDYKSSEGISGTIGKYARKAANATLRLFNTQKQRSAAFRKVIAEKLISEINNFLAHNPNENANKIINDIYQLALITNKDVRDIGNAFNLQNDLMQKLKNFKPNSAAQAEKLRITLYNQINKKDSKVKDFKQLEKNFKDINKVKISDDFTFSPPDQKSNDNTYAQYCTVELAQHLFNKIQKDPKDIESIKLLSLISNKSEQDILSFVNPANDAKGPPM